MRNFRKTLLAAAVLGVALVLGFIPAVKTVAQGALVYVQTVVGSSPPTVGFNELTTKCVYTNVTALLSGQAVPLPCDSTGRLAVTAIGTIAAPAMTYQGNLTLAAATSTAVSTLTLAPNSAAFPSTMGVMLILNTGTNPTTICWFGGTCSATNGMVLVAGASRLVNLGAATTVPTAFSTSGTTLSIDN